MALTNAQVFEHVGRMVQYAFTSMLNAQNREKFVEFAEHTLRAGKQYVAHGAGVAADRQEAMLAFHRGVYQALYGHNPTDGQAGQHAFEAHYLPSQDDAL